MTAAPVPDRRRRASLRADCASCFGLCCVVPAFSVSAEFAIDKAAGALHGELGAAYEETERLTNETPASLRELDVAAHRQVVNTLLLRTSELVRSGARPQGVDRRGADLVGADLKGADLRAANVRGAHLIGADLGGADLRWANVVGADFRGADLSGADLTGSIFLTQARVNAARGDADTELPPSLARPTHWSLEEAAP